MAGGLAALATTALGQSVWAFPIVAVITAGYLWRKPLAAEAIGSGLYISAGLLILIPVLSSIPSVIGTPSDPERPMLIGSILGFVTWSVLFFLIAMVFAALGYHFKGRAAINESDRGIFPR